MERLSYVLPLRWRTPEPVDELTEYLRWLAGRLHEVIVVDGSPQPRFDRHHDAWAGVVSHVPPDPDLTFLYGKVNGVVTGLRHASGERVVIADDDVRYDARSLDEVAALLDDFDLVRPQNYFSPLPWHARWDTARTLLNRATGGDFPGTLAVRRSTFWRAGGYDGDVLFENLELMRTVEAVGGSIATPLDCFVRRLPPTTTHFLSQRVRQAYDELARPARLAVWLSVVPVVATLAARRRYRTLAAAATGTVLVAEAGRRRARGATVFPATSSLLAPAWVMERAVCSWLALYQRARRGGVVYGDTVIPHAATPTRVLQRRLRPLRKEAPGRPPGSVRSTGRSPGARRDARAGAVPRAG